MKTNCFAAMIKYIKINEHKQILRRKEKEHKKIK